jgi:magnesium-transporting ATPase (P-type)
MTTRVKHDTNYVWFQKVESEGEDPVNIENTLWANTVVATGISLSKVNRQENKQTSNQSTMFVSALLGTAVGIVVYTGRETRNAMNTTSPTSKVRNGGHN